MDFELDEDLQAIQQAAREFAEKKMAAASDPAAVRQQKLKEFFDRYVNPYYSAALQHVDDIIDPREMRPTIIRALELSRNKQDPLPVRKHGNMLV